MCYLPQPCGEQHLPIKTLYDNALQHAPSSNGVTLVTAYFERWLAKISGPGSALIVFHNRWGSSPLRGSPIAKSGYVVVFYLF